MMSENSYLIFSKDGLVLGLFSDKRYRIALYSFVIGMVIRFILIPITSSPFDEGEGWVAIIDGFYSGDDLYSSGWYLYPPIWGYVLSIIGEIAQLFGMTSFGDVFAIYGDKFNCIGYNYVTTLEFNTLIKTPALIFDVLTGLAIYRLAYRLTKDIRKSCVCFAAWFLCPVVIVSSTCLAMFDSIIVLLIVLSMVTFLEKRYFMTGVLVALGALTKFFPLMMTPVMAAYILSDRSLPMKARIRNLIHPLIGMVIIFVLVYLPVLINGQLIDSLTFITMRSDSAVNNGFSFAPTFNNLIYYSPLILLEYILLMRFVIRSKEEDRETTILWALLLSFVPIFALPFVSYTPTYGIVLVPSFVILYCLKGDIAWWAWLSLLVFPLHGILHYWGQMFYPLAAFTDIVDFSSLQQEFPIFPIYVFVTFIMCLSGFSFAWIYFKFRKNKELMEVDAHFD